MPGRPHPPHGHRVKCSQPPVPRLQRRCIWEGEAAPVRCSSQASRKLAVDELVNINSRGDFLAESCWMDQVRQVLTAFGLAGGFMGSKPWGSALEAISCVVTCNCAGGVP